MNTLNKTKITTSSAPPPSIPQAIIKENGRGVVLFSASGELIYQSHAAKQILPLLLKVNNIRAEKAPIPQTLEAELRRSAALSGVGASVLHAPPALSLRLSTGETAMWLLPELYYVSKNEHCRTVERRLCRLFKMHPDISRYTISQSPATFKSLKCSRYLRRSRSQIPKNEDAPRPEQCEHQSSGFLQAIVNALGLRASFKRALAEKLSRGITMIASQDLDEVLINRFNMAALTALMVFLELDPKKREMVWFEEGENHISLYMSADVFAAEPSKSAFSGDDAEEDIFAPFSSIISEVLFRAVGAKSELTVLNGKARLKITLSKHGDFLFEVRKKKLRSDKRVILNGEHASR